MKNSCKIILVMLISLGSCNKKHETVTYQTKPEFINAYIDLLYLQERLGQASPAYKDSALIIIKKNNLTQLECMQIIEAINRRPGNWKNFLQEVFNQIENIDSTQTDIRDSIKNLTNRSVK